jgi:hypothetical protein
MAAEESRIRFVHRGREFEAIVIKRPFREGLEVKLEVDGKVIHLAELGLGEKAIVERLKNEIDRILK